MALGVPPYDGATQASCANLLSYYPTIPLSHCPTCALPVMAELVRWTERTWLCEGRRANISARLPCLLLVEYSRRQNSEVPTETRTAPEFSGRFLQAAEPGPYFSLITTVSSPVPSWVRLREGGPGPELQPLQ